MVRHRIPTRAAALAVAVLAVLLLQAARPTPAPAASSATLVFQTVPHLRGVGLTLDGVTYRTGASGSVTVATFAGTHNVALQPTTTLPAGKTAEPHGWLGQHGIPSQITLPAGRTVEYVSYVVSRPVSVSLVDHAGRLLPPGQIDQVVLANSLGQQFSLRRGQTQVVLPLNGVVHPHTGYVSVPLRYSVRSVIYQGGQVVHRGSQVFAAGAPTPWVIKALVFPLQIKAQDALFHFSIGRSVVLAPSFGARRTLTLGPGHTVRVEGLPRGTYDLTPHGPGYGFTSVTTLSRPQEARVLLFSWVDMGVVVVFAALFVIGLPLVSGRLRGRRGAFFLHWRERGTNAAATAGPAAPSQVHGPTGASQPRTVAPLEAAPGSSTRTRDAKQRKAS